MELEHHFTVPASLEETWAAFNDPALVAPCFPGATLVSVDGDEFTGSAKIKLGPIALQYNGVGTYVERDKAAYRAVIEAKGKDKRGNGTANATVTAVLKADGDGTAVHVTTDLAITGKPAQFGRGVMQDVSDKLLQQFVACLQTKLGTPEAAQVSSVEEHAPPARIRAVHDDPAEQAGAGSSGAVAGGEPGGQTNHLGVANHRAAPAIPRTQGPSYSPGSSSTPGLASTPAEVELNLLTTVGRVLLTRYAARALGPVAFLVGYLLGRRSRR